mgnify:CR=1 FL=1
MIECLDDNEEIANEVHEICNKVRDGITYVEGCHVRRDRIANTDRIIRERQQKKLDELESIMYELEKLAGEIESGYFHEDFGMEETN